MRTLRRLTFLVAGLVILIYGVGCNSEPTISGGHVGTITSLSPAVPYTQDTVIAHGYNFGDMHMAGMVRCGDKPVHMISWADTAVCFVAPDSAFSGTLQIQCSCGGTASAMFPITVRTR